MSPLRYVEAQPQDLDRLESFLGPAFRAVYEHEYRSSGADRSVLCMALDGERVIGTQAFIPYELVINGRRMLTGRSERTLVSPEYRGQDVFANLMNLCCERGREKGHQFFWGASTPAVKAFMRSGFLHLTGHREYLVAAVSSSAAAHYLRSSTRPIPLGFRAALRALRGGEAAALEYFKLGTTPVSIVSRAVGRIRRGFARRDVVITTEERREGDLDALLERLRGKQSSVVIPHDRPFLGWVFDQGQNDGTWLLAYEGDELTGFVCVSMNDPFTATIVDFAAADAASLRGLLMAARAEADRRGRAFLLTVCNPLNALQRPLLRGFWEAGFVRSFRAGGTSVIRPGAYQDMSILSNPAPWYMTNLWSMLYESDKRSPGFREPG